MQLGDKKIIVQRASVGKNLGGVSGTLCWSDCNCYYCYSSDMSKRIVVMCVCVRV